MLLPECQNAGLPHPSLIEGLTVSRPPASFWGLDFQPHSAVGTHVTSPPVKALATETTAYPCLSSALKGYGPLPTTVGGVPWEGLLSAHAWPLLGFTQCTPSLGWFRCVPFRWDKSEPQG